MSILAFAWWLSIYVSPPGRKKARSLGSHRWSSVCLLFQSSFLLVPEQETQKVPCSPTRHSRHGPSPQQVIQPFWRSGLPSSLSPEDFLNFLALAIYLRNFMRENGFLYQQYGAYLKPLSPGSLQPAACAVFFSLCQDRYHCRLSSPLIWAWAHSSKRLSNTFPFRVVRHSKIQPCHIF